MSDQPKPGQDQVLGTDAFTDLEGEHNLKTRIRAVSPEDTLRDQALFQFKVQEKHFKRERNRCLGMALVGIALLMFFLAMGWEALILSAGAFVANRALVLSGLLIVLTLVGSAVVFYRPLLRFYRGLERWF